MGATIRACWSRGGIAHPVERVRVRAQALGRLCELVDTMGPIASMAVAHTTNEPEMEQLAFRLSQFFPEGEIIRSRCGATDLTPPLIPVPIGVLTWSLRARGVSVRT
jgi:hypothetical protein